MAGMFATCPKCGGAYSVGSAFCGRCGYRVATDEKPKTNSPFEESIAVQSPLELPHYCARCGVEASKGPRINKTIYYFSPLVWLGLFVYPIFAWLAYYHTRKPLQASYSLCDRCASVVKTKKRVMIAAWAVSAVALVVAVWLLGLHDSSAGIIFYAVTFYAAAVATFIARSPLRAVGYRNGVFTVKCAATSKKGSEALDGVGWWRRRSTLQKAEIALLAVLVVTGSVALLAGTFQGK